MAGKLVVIRLAKCCRNCRQYRRKSWVQMKVSICALTGERITQVAYCSRFRWAAGLRPPKPAKPEGLTVRQVAGLGMKPEELPHSEQAEEACCD